MVGCPPCPGSPVCAGDWREGGGAALSAHCPALPVMEVMAGGAIGRSYPGGAGNVLGGVRATGGADRRPRKGTGPPSVVNHRRLRLKSRATSDPSLQLPRDRRHWGTTLLRAKQLNSGQSVRRSLIGWSPVIGVVLRLRGNGGPCEANPDQFNPALPKRTDPQPGNYVLKISGIKV
jgi:hypothetical protein